MPIVWGHKTFSEREKSFAAACPHCGEKTIADVMVYKKSSHVYFIYYKTVELGKYALCRLCSGLMEMPLEARPVQIDESDILATAEYIEVSNPRIASTEIPDFPVPAGISRRNWAVINNLTNSLGNQNRADSIADGNIQGIVILFVMVAVFWLSAMFVSFDGEGRIVALSLSGIVIALLSWKVYKLCILMKYKATHKEVAGALKRFLDFSGQDIDQLIDDSESLKQTIRSSGISFFSIGPDYKNVVKYLKWAAAKI